MLLITAFWSKVTWNKTEQIPCPFIDCLETNEEGIGQLSVWGRYFIFNIARPCIHYHPVSSQVQNICNSWQVPGPITGALNFDSDKNKNWTAPMQIVNCSVALVPTILYVTLQKMQWNLTIHWIDQTNFSVCVTFEAANNWNCLFLFDTSFCDPTLYILFMPLPFVCWRLLGYWLLMTS